MPKLDTLTEKTVVGGKRPTWAKAGYVVGKGENERVLWTGRELTDEERKSVGGTAYYQPLRRPAPVPKPVTQEPPSSLRTPRKVVTEPPSSLRKLRPGKNGDPLGDPADGPQGQAKPREATKAENDRFVERGSPKLSPSGREYVRRDAPKIPAGPKGETPQGRKDRILRATQNWAYDNVKAAGGSEEAARSARTAKSTAAYAQAVIEGDKHPSEFAREVKINPVSAKAAAGGGSVKQARKKGSIVNPAILGTQGMPASDALYTKALREGTSPEEASRMSDDVVTLGMNSLRPDSKVRENATLGAMEERQEGAKTMKTIGEYAGLIHPIVQGAVETPARVLDPTEDARTVARTTKGVADGLQGIPGLTPEDAANAIVTLAAGPVLKRVGGERMPTPRETPRVPSTARQSTPRAPRARSTSPAGGVIKGDAVTSVLEKYHPENPKGVAELPAPSRGPASAVVDGAAVADPVTALPRPNPPRRRNMNANRERGAVSIPGTKPRKPKPPRPVAPKTADVFGSTPPKPRPKTRVGEFLKTTLVDDRAPAQAAVDQFEAVTGTKVAGTDYDLINRVDAAGRAQAKGEMYAQHGIPDANGKIVPGLDAIRETAKKNGIDLTEWKRYRRMRRRLYDIQNRPDSMQLDPAQVAEATQGIADMRAKYGEKLQPLDRMYDDLTRADLEYRERNGLLEPGGAADLGIKNPNYFPGHRMPTVEELEASFYGTGQAPGGGPSADVVKAMGHDADPMDGLDATSLGIQKSVQAVEMNDALRPFIEEAAKHPEMSDWVRPIDPTKGVPDGFSTVKIKNAGVETTYAVSPRLMSAIEGPAPLKGSLRQISDAVKVPANLLRTLTTGKNPIFKLVFNPAIDISSAMMNHGFNPLRALQGLGASAKGMNSALYREWIDSLGSQGPGVRDYIEKQYKFAQSPQKFQALLESKGVRVVNDAFEWIDRVSEGMTRVGFFAQRKKVYLRQGKPPTVAARLAAQDSADLMNFGRAGSLGKMAGRGGVPYANLPAQELAQIARGFKRNPAMFAARYAGAMFAAKVYYDTLLKDDADYQSLNEYAKDRGIYFKAGGKLWCFPLPGMMGAVVVGVPRRIADAQLGKEETPNAIAKIATQTVKSTVSASSPPYLNSLQNTMRFLANNGEVYDAGLMVTRKPGLKARDGNPAPPFFADPNRNYLFAKGQANTLLGPTAGQAVQAIGVGLGYEDTYPNPLSRYGPDPTEGRRQKVRGIDPVFYDSLMSGKRSFKSALLTTDYDFDEAFFMRLKAVGYDGKKAFKDQTADAQQLLMKKLRGREMKKRYVGYGDDLDD